jgi:asparagine synthase (glutamine-hydrolysing)
MCGFTGFVDPKRNLSSERLRAMVTRMSDCLLHRGPDGGAVWTEAETGVALGHRRLSIIDLSTEGDQPMASASGRWIIVYNGEVYNFPEVRAELERTPGALRVPWRGHSDTEIMLAAVEHWGVHAALERFNGMFALALWDRSERTLWLARDRAGEKPLYYGWASGVFLFGSELKSLAAHPRWSPVLDRGALALYTRHNYIPAPYSAYAGISKLAPGTVVRLDVERLAPGVAPEPIAYWSPSDAVSASLRDPFTGSDEEAIGALDSLLRDAVRMRMIADVPLGAFLSGGIDSSTIVAMMQAQSARPVRTFTIGFNEAGFNEAEHAKAVATHLGTDHTELYVSSSEAQAVIPRLSTMYDEPFADSSQIPTYLVAALARKHVTVALSGDGGDELFGGYQRYFIGAGAWQRMARIPAPLRTGVAAGITRLSPERWQRLAQAVGPFLPSRFRRHDMGRLVHRVADVLGSRSAEAFYTGLVSQEQQPARLIGAAEPPSWLTTPSRWPEVPSFTERMMFLDLVSYLPDDILVKVDRAAMAVSLEGRIPLLDHRVIELAWRLPIHMKVRGGEGKWIFRRVLDRYVPRTLIDRPKMGFGVPIGEWLRGPLREWGESLLSERALGETGVLDVSRVREAWTTHQSGRENRQYWLWTVLMLQDWLRTHGAVAIAA